MSSVYPQVCYTKGRTAIVCCVIWTSKLDQYFHFHPQKSLITQAQAGKNQRQSHYTSDPPASLTDKTKVFRVCDSSALPENLMLSVPQTISPVYALFPYHPQSGTAHHTLGLSVPFAGNRPGTTDAKVKVILYGPQ